MEIAITLLIISTVAVMFWSVSVSKRLSIAVFSAVFFGAAIAMIVWQGFTQQAIENIGVIAFVLLIGWLRISISIANRTRARAWLNWEDSNSSAICEKCGAKHSYQQIPKDLSLLLLRRFKCPNCGAKSKIRFDTSKKENAG